MEIQTNIFQILCIVNIINLENYGKKTVFSFGNSLDVATEIKCCLNNWFSFLVDIHVFIVIDGLWLIQRLNEVC